MAEIAITGGIGSGKTTVAKLIVNRGAVLVDADQIVKDLQKPKQLRTGKFQTIQARPPLELSRKR